MIGRAGALGELIGEQLGRGGLVVAAVHQSLPAPIGTRALLELVRLSLNAARLALLRDLLLAFRKRGQLLQPLAFFALVTVLFPLSMSPDPARLRELASGALWVGGAPGVAAGARIPVSR